MSDEKSNVVDLTPAPSKEMLSMEDKHVVDLIKVKKALTLANAEKAIAQNETAEMHYNNVVLQLSMKYSLTDKDVITEDGEIKRNHSEPESK